MTSKNVLAKYLAPRGAHAIRDLCALVKKRTRRSIRWQTVSDIAKGISRPTAATAQLLHRSTDGEINASELLGLTQLERAAS